MPESGLLKVAGAQNPAPDKYTSIAFIRLIAGLQTQRSVLMNLDTRYNHAFLGGRPDALLSGSNCEISNRLTLQRRPGLVKYGTANVPPPQSFFDYQLATTGDINLIVDTDQSGGDNNVGPNGGVLRYSPTASGIYVNKSALAQQSNFKTIVNTLYFGDGIDLLKIIGPNLLQQSNTFGTGAGTNFSIQSPWTQVDVFSLTEGQTDPLGGTNATQLIWSTASSSAQLEQNVTPNYTPIASNTFTFSFWMKHSGTAISVDLEIADQNGSLVDTTFALTTSWVKYSVTATMNSNSNVIKVLLRNPTTTQTMFIYGAQLEVGGPATTTQITTNLPQGVFLWGIQAPATAPSVSPTPAVIGTAWAPNTVFATKQYSLTQSAGSSGGSNVYTGKFPNGNSNGLAGQSFTITNFLNTVNNGYFTCSASTSTTITVNNAAAVPETIATTSVPAVATPTVTLTSVAASVGETAVYQGTIAGGGSNDLAGYGVVIATFVNAGNNGAFVVASSTGSTLTVINPNAVAEITSAKAQIIGRAVTDSNGNMEFATSTGTSGTTPPTWNVTEGQETDDGQQTVFIIQTTPTGYAGSASASTTFQKAVTAGNSILVAVAADRNSSQTATISDTSTNAYTLIGSSNSGFSSIFLFYCKSAAAGTPTVTVADSGAGAVWVQAAELSPLTATDGSVGTNNAASVASGSGTFQTGAVSTTSINDIIVSLSCIIAGNHAASTSSLPSGYTSILSASQVQLSEGYGTINLAFDFFNYATAADPQWSINLSASGGRTTGITQGFVAAKTATLVWTNYGPIGLTAAIGFSYYFAFMNSETGHLSNVSPLSVSTGVLAGQSVVVSGTGMQTTNSGPYNQDPQVDTIVLFRNDDGGGFYFQLATFSNPGTATSPGTWTYTDITPDGGLDTAISAPIGLLNSLPPAGLVDMEFFAGRLWGSVGNFLYYSTGPDNAALLNVSQNGVIAESWIPTNFVPFDSPITRILAVGGYLLVATTTDTWLINGINLLQGGFNPIPLLVGHGLRSYNAISLDGSTIYMYTSDRQMLQINPNSGSIEVGELIGDYLEENFSPVDAYVVRHVAGSRDNAVFLADGSTQWIRLNPNQAGASMGSEQTPVWSPAANFTASIGGLGAIASIETSAGTIQLLCGQSSTGPVLARSLATFSDNGTPYPWNAVIGSILLANSGELAETESLTVQMNQSGGSFTSTACSVGVLLDEIAGAFESLPASVNDPPQLKVSSTILASRYYLSQGTQTPICQHMQINLTGAVTSGLPASSMDEILSITIRGAKVSEQS